MIDGREVNIDELVREAHIFRTVLDTMPGVQNDPVVRDELLRPLGQLATNLLQGSNMLVVATNRCIPVTHSLEPAIQNDGLGVTMFGGRYHDVDVVMVSGTTSPHDDLEMMWGGGAEIVNGLLPAVRFKVFDETGAVQDPSVVELFPYVAVPLVGSDIAIARHPTIVAR
ncbi:MAG: hypothetical protein WAT17_00215 [Candidatus Saccharimonadales bacterium]|jgi:hypothetical protein